MKNKNDYCDTRDQGYTENEGRAIGCVFLILLFMLAVVCFAMFDFVVMQAKIAEQRDTIWQLRLQVSELEEEIMEE